MDTPNILYNLHSVMYVVEGLTQMQQVWGNRGAHSGEHGTRRHGCVSDDCRKQLTSEYVQHSDAGQNPKLTQQHQGQGDSWITCREKGGTLLMRVKQVIVYMNQLTVN